MGMQNESKASSCCSVRVNIQTERFSITTQVYSGMYQKRQVRES